ncbi:MAG TPA: fumarylacetoacetate hydrolase family protein [Gaiellaceae bacterium]|nr:fumarylacetoacetate hydrolase family protein [Gaiellaceae bacterium]
MSGFGVFATAGDGTPRVGWRAGADVVDLSALGDAFRQPSLNALMVQGPGAWAKALAQARAHDGPRTPIADASLLLPFEVADYVDFYSSLEHATNLGRLFRPDAEPLLPNWRRLPVGYHGRAGTVAVTGSDVVRPRGQITLAGAEEPVYEPSRRLDVELELGFVVGVPSGRGTPVPAERFAEHVFGVVLVNDWSARDIQAWEYVPLGPFCGKSFLTSVSAWVTPLALLEEHRTEAPPQDPLPLAHLAGGRDWALDVELEVELNGFVVSRGNARALYWTMPQQLAHATSNGASVRTGDLMATGTISGSAPGSEGSLIELTRNGAEPIRLPDGGTRSFLEDGDEVVLRARAGDVELGEVRGRVAPAR